MELSNLTRHSHFSKEHKNVWLLDFILHSDLFYALVKFFGPIWRRLCQHSQGRWWGGGKGQGQGGFRSPSLWFLPVLLHQSAPDHLLNPELSICHPFYWTWLITASCTSEIFTWKFQSKIALCPSELLINIFIFFTMMMVIFTNNLLKYTKRFARTCFLTPRPHKSRKNYILMQSYCCIFLVNT